MANASYLSSYFVNMTLGLDYHFKIYSYDSSHLHKVVLKCGSYSKTWDRVKGGVQTTFTVPKEWANAMPNATSLNGTWTLTTYQSNYSTKVGSNDVETTKFNVPATMKPTVNVNTSEAIEGIAEQFGAYVQGRSKIKVDITASGIYGSTIKKYNTTVNGVTYTSNSFTTGALKESGFKSCSTTVTDSRGKTQSDSNEYTVLAYTKPKITNFSVARCLEDGTLNDEGTFVKVISGATIDEVREKNTKAFKLSYKLTNEENWTDIDITGDEYILEDERILSGFNIDNTYNFKIEATDFFETQAKIINLETSDNIMDFLANGKGMAIGKASEHEDTLDVGYTNMFLPKENYMGGNKRSDDEKNIIFNNTGNGDYNHNVKIYGGTGTSPVALGIWDFNGEHRVIYYEDGTKTLRLDPNIKLSGFKNIATVIGSSDYTLTTTDVSELPMKASVTLGSKLSVSNGQVIIGAGVNYVKIEGSIYAHSGFVENDLVHCNILKNTSTIYTAMKRIKNSYETIAGSGKIISVAEGDVIKLCVRNQTEARGMVSGTGNSTYMTVEVVG